MQKRYPFKFLDAYTREDSDIFFGRTEEVAALYEMVFQTDLLLVQGPSGAGKTSLIKCGLASKFQSHDWLALDIRRGSNLNESLRQALLQAGGTDVDTTEQEDLDWLDDDLSVVAPEPTPITAPLQSPLTHSLRALYRKYFKPVYLIFDQFEELYTIGDKTEQDAFVEQVKEILRVQLPVKIILSIREEYLGHLYDFERKVPELQRKKLRVEPMNLEKVKEVILKAGNLKNGNVRLKSGEEVDIATSIFEKIKEKEQTLTVELPYLQVFLDKLYIQTTGDETRQAEAEFSLDQLNTMGDMGDILRDFLDEQVLKISADLKEKPETIWQLLSPFVTLDGTKEPLSEMEFRQRLKNHSPELLNTALDAFAKARILRYSEQDQRYEIKHDSLAKRIHAKRSDDDIALLEVQRLVKNQLLSKPEVRELFTEKQLGFIEPMKEKLTLLPEETEWIRLSEEGVAKEKETQAKALETERKLKEEAIASERKAIANARKARTWSYVAGVVALLSIGISFFAWGQYIEAKAATKIANDKEIEARQERDKAKAAQMLADSSAVQARTEKTRAEQKTLEAEKNLQRAKQEEKRTQAALVQVNKEKAATEEQRIKAQSALEETKKALSEVIRLSLQESEKLILAMDYEGAVEKIKSLIPLGVSEGKVGSALLEPVFWYAETGELERARGLLDTAYLLSGRRLVVGGVVSRGNLRSALQALDASRDSFLEARYFPRMVELPGGNFEMGDDSGYNNDEKPAHRVEVSSFRMAKTETTWWQYGLYVAARGGEVALPEVPGWGISGDNPVVNVSWYDAIEYANWLSERQGVARAYPTTGEDVRWDGPRKPGYRLPTEAEWEYAARGGKQQEYAGTNNEEELGEYAWYDENSGSRTHVVGEKSANSFGLYDLSGNVYEWCWDWYDRDDYESYKEKGKVVNPLGPIEGSDRVFRGGSWDFSAGYCRSANRSIINPGLRTDDIGFRLVFVPQ